MTEAQDHIANNLDDAWSNFDPDVALPHGSPFFVELMPPPLGQLKRALLRKHVAPQKYFLAGFKGSGKSSHLNQLAGDHELQSRYFVVKFTIRDTCDERNIDYVDLLVALGSRLFTSFSESGGELEHQLYEELQTWGSKVEERIRERQAGALVEAGVGGGLNWLLGFFANITAKIKMEYSSRGVIREVLEPQLSELLQKINLIAAGIQAKTKKNILVLVDDTDKPLPEQAAALFKNHLAPLLEPHLYIVYTVPVWVLFSPEFPDIREPKAFLLPNVRISQRDDRTRLDPAGFATMKDFVGKRMSRSLIEEDALEEAIRMSGGVFREATRILQMAVDHAFEQEETRVRLENVQKATTELRRDYRRILTELSQQELATLRNIKDSRRYRGGERVSRLLDNLLVLEYINEENWPDVNPLLWDVLE